MSAVAAVTNYQPISPPLNFSETSTQALFGANVFSKCVMKDRLPKPVYQSLLKTIELGEMLDSTMADIVAAAMKDWAMEKGATHYAHVFFPLTGGMFSLLLVFPGGIAVNRKNTWENRSHSWTFRGRRSPLVIGLRFFCEFTPFFRGKRIQSSRVFVHFQRDHIGLNRQS